MNLRTENELRARILELESKVRGLEWQRDSARSIAVTLESECAACGGTAHNITEVA